MNSNNFHGAKKVCGLPNFPTISDKKPVAFAASGSRAPTEIDRIKLVSSLEF